ncbi:MAG TPA: hypothetical protein VD735_04930 [Candidatus Saccharimonadales bacterium]|nr:hypothetical protein [Candidatus Saccharimonadales bacterium]
MSNTLPTVVWLFGADGAGKTQLTSDLMRELPSDLNAVSFTGSRPDTWPDDRYSELLRSAGFDEATSRDPNYFRLKTSVSYALAAHLATKSSVVIIDSCVRGKTVLAEYAADTDEVGQRVRLITKSDDLGRLAAKQLKGRASELGVHVTWGNNEQHALDTRSAVVFDRVCTRDVPSDFDPTTLTQTALQIAGADKLEKRMGMHNQPVLRVDTNSAAYDIVRIKQALLDRL